MATEASEKPARAEEAESPPRRFWRRIPTPILVTFIGIALSAWLLPAITRQWDDRQNVRELRAAFAEEISNATASALSGGKEAARANGTFRPIRVSLISGEELQKRRARLAPIEAAWDATRLKEEMKLGAYYSDSVASQWTLFADQVRAFLDLCLWSGPVQGKRRAVQALQAVIARDLNKIGFEFGNRPDPVADSRRFIDGGSVQVSTL
jgi:hypothetical protein